MEMSKQLGKGFKRLLLKLQQPLAQKSRVSIIALSVAGCVLLLRSVGLLQSWEWAALDQFFRLRAPEPVDERIVIVAIDEDDLRKVGQWPLPDPVIAQLLQKLHAKKPRAIGLDLYRDLPVEPGHGELLKAYKSIPNLIGIEQLADQNNVGVPPPPELSHLNSVGFNNVILDADGKLRRGFLYWTTPSQVHESFALKLALIYLKTEGITPQPATNNPQYLQLGQGVFRPFEQNDGAYVRADAGGYQILSNFRHPEKARFRTVSMTDVLGDRVEPSLVRDRIVIIGSTAPSLKDLFYTPYSGGLTTTAPQPIAGVELHANFLSQILSAALSGRPLIYVWSDLVEGLWIFGWAWVGVSVSWRLRSPRPLALTILLATIALTGGSYLAFVNGWWLPLVPPLLALGGSAVVITAHIAYAQEELKRSKQFLHQVINTIPDPIFVKNQEHRWIVLNEAYCQFIGHPLEVLIEKPDCDFFPKHEADIFWQQDKLVFHSGVAVENEEEFTDARGTTYLIATKRSLHKDAAGNLFLVGVIRDITSRKRIEEELKRTALELFQSNTELKLSENRLRYLAHHDTLTGLPNRQMFHEHLNQSLAWAQSNNLLVALLFIDLDGFKQVNDTLGHDNGDRLLVTVAQRLTACLRSSDIVSRLGGDEFTAVLPSIPGKQEAASVAEKILATLSEAFVLEGHNAFISASIGISIYPLDGEESETLIKQADAAMYRAKQSGKNRYEFACSNP